MKKKRTPWPRWEKVLRNILLTALLGFMMWDLWGHPTFFYMEDLRRRERQMLLPEPETVVELDTTFEKRYRIEVADDVAVTSYPLRGHFFTNANMFVHYLSDGPDFLCIPVPVERQDEWGQPLTYTAYAVVHPPEDAAAAMLTLCKEGGETTAEGVRESSVFLFYVRPEPDENGVTSYGTTLHAMGYSSYEVAFFDAEGGSVCRVSG